MQAFCTSYAQKRLERRESTARVLVVTRTTSLIAVSCWEAHYVIMQKTFLNRLKMKRRIVELVVDVLDDGTEITEPALVPVSELDAQLLAALYRQGAVWG